MGSLSSTHREAVLERQTNGRCEPQSQLLVHTHVLTRERERERETSTGLYIGDMIAFSIFYL
jgi:hypothetical protein